MFKLVVLSSVLALAAAGAIAPLGLGLAGPGWAGLAAPWGARLAAPWAGHVAAPLAAPVAYGAPVLGAYNYRGPLSLAPGQPANILASDGRPLDTLSVNLDRAAHYTARAVDGHGVHVLRKRSAVLAAPVAWSHTARIDAPAARLVAPAPYVAAAPYAWGAPNAYLGLGAAVAPWGHATAWGRHW